MATESDRSPPICVLSSKRRDAELTCAHLREVDIATLCASTFDELVEQLRGPVGAVMVTEDAIPQDGWSRLSEVIAQQPAWSDLPVIVFSRTRQRILDNFLSSGSMNLTVVETPVRVTTVVSSARAALRARRRQYEIRDLLERLEDTDRRKDEFLAMLGHELRNPLAAVQLAVQVKQIRSPDMEHDRQMQIIQRQLRNLARIVDDLLDVSRVTMGKIQLDLKVVDLCEVAKRCVQALAHEAEASRLRLEIKTADCPVFVHGDVVRIEQVLSNLVTNAIKYTPAGGVVQVEVPRSDPPRIGVRDTGIGIDASMLPLVFDLFAQATQGIERSRGGLGLGLALVKRLVELHGGSVRAHSDGPARGSLFEVSFPTVAIAEANRETTSTPMRRASSMRMLVVEDNEDARAMLVDLLEDQEHRVQTAADGLSGLHAALEDRYDVLLVDIGLPKIDGHELARQVRLRAPQQPWMIAMTGYGQPADRERALEAGFDMFIVKPVDIAELERLLAWCGETSRIDRRRQA